MGKTFQKPLSLTESDSHYCPGCTHGIAHRLIAEVIDELGIRGRTVGIAPVGCAVLAYNYLDFDFQEAAHGRAPALATGIKGVRPDLVVFTYQGDGDLASIGMGEIIHAANRGEKFTTIFINNAVYGMTGGQMAPTTMPGQRTTTSPLGRNVNDVGMPIQVAELLSSLQTPAYITRQSIIKPKYIVKAKKAIKRAFEYQLEGRCFSFVELVSTCPTNWGLTPVEAVKWAEESLLPYYRLGEFKTRAMQKGEGARMQSEVMFAGFGGQGILFSAKILAHAALEQGFEVVWIPSYGAEMRGGTAYCMVVISDRPIASPIVRNPQHLVAMNRPSLEKFAPVIKPGGVIMINSSLISCDAGRKDVDEIKIPVNDMAMEIGNVKAANIVALGAFVGRSKMVNFEILQESVKTEFATKAKLIPLNMAALERGRMAAQEYRP